MSITHLVGLTAIATIWMGAKPAVGYLTRVGPAPLRFQAPSRGPEALVALPPLAMKDPEPEVEYFGPPPPPETPIVIEAAATNTPPAVLAPQTDPNGSLTPQMLIQFFNGRSRSNQDYNVLLPFQFNPPPAPNIPAPPSRANYQVK